MANMKDEPAVEGIEELPADPAWWVDWHAEAVAAGVQRDVAEAGRTLIRVSYEECGPPDRWDEEISTLSGVDDDGLAMIKFALLRPQTALRVWRRIAETSGLRGVRMCGRLVPWDRDKRRLEKAALLAELARPERLD
jgi:hypothetical protein